MGEVVFNELSNGLDRVLFDPEITMMGKCLAEVTAALSAFHDDRCVIGSGQPRLESRQIGRLGKATAVVLVMNDQDRNRQPIEGKFWHGRILRIA
jgi:hypothetical protein